MPLSGTLSTMSLPDLLQWLGNAAKTGTLRVELDRTRITLRLRDGRVVGTLSDDPPQRLGQFLLSRNSISEEQLRQALSIKESNGRLLGQTLVEMGALTADDLLEQLSEKAEEIIHSLFDLKEATFAFETVVDEGDDVFPVDLRFEDVLLRGMQRMDEMKQIRVLLVDDGIVLRYTRKPPGPEIFGNEASHGIYSAIDGERTLKDIRLHVHGTEYQVNRLLADLVESGYLEIAAHKPIPTRSDPPAAPPSEMPLQDEVADETDRDRALSQADPSPLSVPEMRLGESASSPAVPRSRASRDGSICQVTAATTLLDGGQYEQALCDLEALHQASPGDDSLRRLTAEAEAAFVEHLYATDLLPTHVPLLTRSMENMASEKLSPQEFFMLSRIDGSWDIRSIIQVAPFREVEALRTLRRMIEMGIIELCAQ